MEVKASWKQQPGTRLIFFLLLVLAPSVVVAAPSPDHFSPEVAKLVGGPRHYTPIVVKARRLRAAIGRDEFRLARKTLKEALKKSRIGMFHFYPFAALADDTDSPGDKVYLKGLNTWIARDPKLAVAYVLRAQYEFDTGSAVRGTRVIDHVQPNHVVFYEKEMTRASADLDRAIRLDPADPFPWFLRAWMLKSDGSEAQLDTVFRQAIQRFPNYYPLYRMRLNALEPKWGGTPQQMYAFLARYAKPAPRYSPLKMLYLQAYDEFLDTAWFSCRQYQSDVRPRCFSAFMGHLVTENLEKSAYAALSIYRHTADKYAVIEKLNDYLGDMVNTSGGERYSGAFLQLAATRLDTDNQLVPDHTNTNVYMIDDQTGNVWYDRGQYNNAITMYRRAISDLPHTRFPSPEARDRVLSGLYSDIADADSAMNQYKKAIVYERAANILLAASNPGEDRLICSDLLKLKRYHLMLHDCPVQLRVGSDAHIAYWRARAYGALGNKAEAIRYFRFVANSEDGYRASAVIDMANLYPENKKGWQHMIKSLNAYPYIFNPDAEGNNTVAIAYNNRCYAKMKLGMLKAALKDCTASLQYGNLPDAFQKQQRLIQLLRAQGKLAN